MTYPEGVAELIAAAERQEDAELAGLYLIAAAMEVTPKGARERVLRWAWSKYWAPNEPRPCPAPPPPPKEAAP